MKIERVDVFQVDLPVASGTYILSGGRQFGSFDATIVRLTTQCGLEGWGESTPFGATYIPAHAGGVRAGLALLAPEIIGADPRHHDRLNDTMNRALAGHNATKAALDVAAWDITGKAFGLPVADLLGGRFPTPFPVISSIGIDTPQAMRQNVENHRNKGFKGHSIKIGATQAEGGPALDAARITACLADKRQNEWFLVDANNGLTPEQACRLTKLLPENLDFVFEAPCSSFAATALLRQQTTLPMLLDELIEHEEDLIHAIKLGLCDGVGLKISKQGGITRTRRQREIAQAAGLVVSIQETTGSEIAFAAIAHIAQSTAPATLRCALDCRAMISRSIAAFDAPIIDGGVRVPDKPGLGVVPDLDTLGAPIASYEG